MDSETNSEAGFAGRIRVLHKSFPATSILKNYSKHILHKYSLAFFL